MPWPRGMKRKSEMRALILLCVWITRTHMVSPSHCCTAASLLTNRHICPLKISSSKLRSATAMDESVWKRKNAFRAPGSRLPSRARTRMVAEESQPCCTDAKTASNCTQFAPAARASVVMPRMFETAMTCNSKMNQPAKLESSCGIPSCTNSRTSVLISSGSCDREAREMQMMRARPKYNVIRPQMINFRNCTAMRDNAAPWIPQPHL
mmetsp:Transcript_95636/g.279678  ORF Transcript_95636/g.279678 Transcript_95636/m.279678 type:complete len:208 (-) Transcript_95636:745-1368(-)